MLLHIGQPFDRIAENVVDEVDGDRHAHRYQQPQQFVGEGVDMIIGIFGYLPDLHQQQQCIRNKEQQEEDGV